MARILVIDDDPDIRSMVCDALRANGHEVIDAEDGTTGITAALECSPDLVMLDLMMPDLDGYAVLSQFRERGVIPGVPVIILTGLNTGTELVEALRRGANDYITKPFKLEELLARTQVQLRIRHLEGKLRESEAYHRALFERSADPDILLDQEGRILQANNAALGLFSSGSDMAGTTFADLLDESERAKFRVAFSGAVDGSDIPIFEVHIRLADGHLHPFDADIGPVEIDNETYLLLRLRDIHRRMAAEARSTMIFEHIGDGVFITDGKGLVMMASRSATELVGCAQDEIVGQDITEYQDLDQSPRWETFTELTASGGVTDTESLPVVAEGVLVRKDGSHVPVEWTMAAFLVASEPYFIGVARDLSDRKSAEEKRLEADRLETLLEIAGGAAHEINQPLTAIMGYAELAEASLPEDNIARQHLGNIVRASQRITGILKQMHSIREYRTRPYANGHEIVDFRSDRS